MPFPSLRRSTPFHAIITPLSVHNLAGGQSSWSPVVSAMMLSALRMYWLLATPPESTYRGDIHFHNFVWDEAEKSGHMHKVSGERRDSLTSVGLLVGSKPFALQNKMARCVRFARWLATVCCVAAAMSFTHDNSVPCSIPTERHTEADTGGNTIHLLSKI